jgi:uncharacterized protein (TIGR00251 family)
MDKIDETIEIEIKVITNSKNNKIFFDENDSIICKLKAKPIRGQANKALIKYLSKIFDISANRISIKKGLKSSTKIIEIINYKIGDLKRKIANNSNK